MTTIYLIRHSVRFERSNIESYLTEQSNLLKNEKIILSVEGEKRAEILSHEDELQNIDVVYASNLVRTLATAKYLCYNQNLKVNIDDRFDERRVGIPNDNDVTDWFTRQYYDPNYKTVGGESQLDVRNRVYGGLLDILSKHKDKRVAIFSHGYAITFLLLKWCKLINIDCNHKFTISYNDKIIYDKKINAPEVFKLTFDGTNLKNLECIEFEDLEFMDKI